MLKEPSSCSGNSSSVLEPAQASNVRATPELMAEPGAIPTQFSGGTEDLSCQYVPSTSTALNLVPAALHTLVNRSVVPTVVAPSIPPMHISPLASYDDRSKMSFSHASDVLYCMSGGGGDGCGSNGGGTDGGGQWWSSSGHPTHAAPPEEPHHSIHPPREPQLGFVLSSGIKYQGLAAFNGLPFMSIGGPSASDHQSAWHICSLPGRATQHAPDASEGTASPVQPCATHALFALARES